MKMNLKDIMEIGDKALDPKTKLEARRIANETLRYIMELVTGGVICTQAFNAVTQIQNKINTVRMIDERIEQTHDDIEQENDQTTTNGVF